MAYTRRSINALGLALLGASLTSAGVGLSGCQSQAPAVASPASGQAGSQTAPKKGGTLTRALTSEPSSLDPQSAASSGLNVIVPFIFDTLLVRKSEGGFVGHLAQSYETADGGKTITLKLREKVTFHDGTPLDAAAVAYTFERFKEAGKSSPIAGDIKSLTKIEAPDPLTVVMRFERPTATFLSALTMPYAAIISPTAAKAAGADFGAKPVGSGPFLLKEWARGASITLERNPSYDWAPPEAKNRGPAYLDKIVLKVVPDATTQVSALQSGDVDLIFVAEPGLVPGLEAVKNLNVQRMELGSLIYLGYNAGRTPFDDARVRRAIGHLVDKEAIVQTALGGLGKVENTPLVPSMLGYDATLGRFGQSFDREKAISLLTEAGFGQKEGAITRDGKPLSLKLLTSTRAPNEAIATLLQSQLKSAGIAVEVQRLDTAATMKVATEGAFDLFLWRYEWDDPDILNTYLSTSRIRQTNRTFYSNPMADELLQQGQRELEAQKRQEIYARAQELLLADAAWQPLYTPIEAVASRKSVVGLEHDSMGRLLINDVWIDASKNTAGAK